VKPTLEEFIAALPECPDCGEKLHRFAYCPGRKTPEKGHTMSNAVITKQGAPSKPGEKVDTSQAKVVKAAAAKAKDEGKAVERKQAIADAAKKMTGGAKPKAPKAKAAKPRGTGNGSGPTTRITESWKGKDGKEVEVKDHVTHGELVGVVKGRWTKRKGDTLIPMVTLTLDKPKDKDKPCHNAPAKECVHVK
jgi:hypothetical protein